MGEMLECFRDVALFSIPIILYALLYRRHGRMKRIFGIYSKPDWNYILKKWWAYLSWIRTNKGCMLNSTSTKCLLPTEEEEAIERPQQLQHEESVDSKSIFGVDNNGNAIFLKIIRRRHRTLEVWINLQLKNGTVYQHPNHPNTVIYSNSAQAWSGGGLKFSICEPFRRWRITFNGLLRRGVQQEWNNKEYDEMEHIRFSFIWKACSKPMDFQADWNPKLISEAIAREPWRNGQWLSMVKEFGSGYDQWGTLYGVLTPEHSDSIVLHLRGLTQRRLGLNPSVWQHRSMTFTGVARSGLMFTLTAASSYEGMSHAIFGHVRLPNGGQSSISWSNISLPETAEHWNCIPNHYILRFKAGDKFYTSVIDILSKNHAKLYGGQPWNSEVFLKPFQCGINSSDAYGISEFWYRYSGKCPVPTSYLQHLREADIKTDSYTVTFADTACQNSKNVGGKGASLSMLSTIQNSKFVVPTGFCLTVRAMNDHLKWNPELENEVHKLVKMCSELDEDKLILQCDSVVKKFDTTPICGPVMKNLEKIISQYDMSQRYAVRSSAVGEDSEDLSAAGQNASFLGISGETEIIKAIQNCWGSLFTYQSVQYRRQHGQLINCDMGVVVQEMVPAEAAGVLFTRHPLSGNPKEILITANYGLGESVVSALSEPDTIVVSRDYNNCLSVKSHILGKKEKIVQMTGEGTVEVDINAEDAEKLCISLENCILLSTIGIELEMMFGNPRDIEWAISEGRIYILQARPITALDVWSDFELLHELDSPIVTDSEPITTGNTGEVLPGAISPLSQSFVSSTIDYVLQKSALRHPPVKYCQHCIVYSQHHAFINILNTVLLNIDEPVTNGIKAGELAVFGRPISKEYFYKLSYQRNGIMNNFGKIKNILESIIVSWKTNKITLKAISISKSFTLNIDNLSAHEIYLEILKNLPVLEEITLYHSTASRVSVFTQVIAMMTIAGDEEFSMDHYIDISKVLSGSNVVSAEVPVLLKELAETIIVTGRGDEFCSLSPPLAIEWLEVNCGAGNLKYKMFLKNHGHRCYKELDLIAEPWSLKPDPVIETIQSMVSQGLHKTKENKAASEDIDEIINRLESVKKDNSRKALKWFLPWCRKAVTNRELSKEAAVRVIHQFRMAFRCLGQAMVNENRLHDPQLVFFLTFYELGQVLKHRNSSILTKAFRRSKLFNQWESLKFPEIAEGIPIPISESIPIELDASSAVRGTPVCPGHALGRACVIKSIRNTSELKRGDILITHSTDIGWSPYFPLLGGLVTEIGGLVSHGAVVAREYGLPCLVGVTDATHYFKTGDIVLLVGSKGTLQKVDNAAE